MLRRDLGEVGGVATNAASTGGKTRAIHKYKTDASDSVPKQIQIEDGSEAKIGGRRLHNATGNAIRVTYDSKKAALDVVACCIGEKDGLQHDP